MSESVKKRSPFEYAKVTFAGFAMGVANVIPGVSGGTMAFILNVFEELVMAIKTIASKDTVMMILKFQIGKMYRELPWRFLLALGIGVIIAFAGVSKLFVKMLDKQPTFTFAFFFGLVIASVIVIITKIKKWKITDVISLIIGAAVAYVMITLVPVSTPNTWYVSFICGVICMCAMILPGVSGSFLLLVLGQYQYVWGAVGDVASGKFSAANINTIFWLGLGAVIGIGAFSHFLGWLFKKHNKVTIAALIGFMLGSVPRLWPWQTIMTYSVKTKDTLIKLEMPGDIALLQTYQNTEAKITPLVVKNVLPDNFDAAFWGAVGLAIAGVAIVLVTEFIAAKSRKNDTASI